MTLAPEFLATPTIADRPPHTTPPLRPAPQGTGAVIHSLRQLCRATSEEPVGCPRGRPLRPSVRPGLADRLTALSSAVAAVAAAAAGWGVSCSLGDRTRSRLQSPSGCPSVPPQRAARPLGGFGSPPACCSRHGRGAAPGRRPQGPPAGDSRAAQQFRVSGRRRPGGWGRPPEAGAPRPPGSRGCGRVPGGGERNGRASELPGGPRGRPEEVLTQQCGQHPDHPVTLAPSALQSRVQGGDAGGFCRELGFGFYFFFSFFFFFKFPETSELILIPHPHPLSAYSVLSFGINILAGRPPSLC